MRHQCQFGRQVLAVVTAVAAVACNSSTTDRPTLVAEGAAPATGGTLIASFRSEPKSFNRYVSARSAEELVARLTHATLVRLDRVTGKLEPRLAADWTSSPDGLTWTFNLRPGIRFSDGTPLTSSDVLFSFEALYHPKVNAGLASNLRVDGKPLGVKAAGDSVVTITFPAPYGPGIAVLDTLPILPKHKLRAALDAGTFGDAWGIDTPPSEIAGLGPFVLQEFVAGQRLRFVRNPHFWRKDDAGKQLPYLDQIELQIVPDQNAEALRLQSGDIDVVNDQARAEDLGAFRQLEKKGALKLYDAGVTVSPDILWFNLTPAAAAVKGRPWLQKDELRRAISHAVDRQAIVNTVFLGAAEPIYGPVTPGHGEWYVPDLPRTEFDQARARTLLAAIGLKDRNGDGLVDDEAGRTARFTVLTAKGHTVRERTVAVIQEQLRQVGLTMDVVTLDPSAVPVRWGKGEYEAIYFSITYDSFEPARYMDFWSSSADFHFWNPNQAKPATPWEANIDALMRQQTTTVDPAERRRLFADAQRVFAEHLPALYFVAAKVTVPTSARVRGVAASVLPPPVLWNAEMLWLSPAAAGARR